VRFLFYNKAFCSVYFIFFIMQIFSNPNITIATAADSVDIKNLLNNAYRGEASKQGWTTEAALIAGDTRTNDTNLRQVMDQPGSVFLKCTNQQQQLQACVNLQQHGNKIYLGMFSVAPQLQGGGIGKQILLAAEEYGKYIKAVSIYMSVITVRTELINWYQRHGYADTGERKPFIEDKISGKHLQPLEFMMLEKLLLPQ
jgi:ribosomal protein S18 acetylase RimI-like enzyme